MTGWTGWMGETLAHLASRMPWLMGLGGGDRHRRRAHRHRAVRLSALTGSAQASPPPRADRLLQGHQCPVRARIAILHLQEQPVGDPANSQGGRLNTWRSPAARHGIWVI